MIFWSHFSTPVWGRMNSACVAAEPLTTEDAEQIMRQEFPDFERYLAKGQIEITPHTNWYLRDGYFDEQRLLQDWIDKQDQAISKGFSGLRLAANIVLEKPDWQPFARFEGKLDETLYDLRVKGLCTYNLNHYSAAMMLDIIRHHQVTLIRREGAWEPLEGAQLKRAHEEVLRLNNELEQRVEERTAELRASNDELNRVLAERKRMEDRLRYHALLLENVHDAIVAVDKHFRITAWNRAAERMYGWTTAEVIGRDLREIVRSEYSETRRSEAFHIIAETGQFSTESIHHRRDGSTFWIDGDIISLRNPEEEVTGYVDAFHDITERKQAEERLREYEKVVEGLEEMIVVVDREYRYVIANQAFLDYRGMKREQVVGHIVSEILGKEVFEKIVKEKLDQCFQGEVVKYEMKYTYPKVGERDLFLSYYPIEGLNSIDRVACILQDITERKQAKMERERLFEELRHSHEQLQILSSRLVEAEESERKRLAREIHDDISQSLTALMMHLGSARSLLPKSAKAARSILEETEALTQNTLERTRLMIAGLRPSILDELGLIPTRHRLADELHESTGATVTLKTKGLPQRLPAQIEIALFRVVQEALNNIRKHAKASEVTVELAKEADHVIVSVHDNGVGIENQEDGSRGSNSVLLTGGWKIPAGHYGLIGTQERVKALGGNFQLTSARNQGSTMHVELPLLER